MNKVLQDCLTGPDGQTHDPARHVFVWGSIAYLVIGVVHGLSHAFQATVFDFQGFAIGLGAIMGGGGAGIAFKAKTEPDASEEAK